MADDISMASTLSCGSLEADDKSCIICAGPSSKKIVRDLAFESVLSAYWVLVNADVKPQENKKFFLCEGCFDMVVELYKTNNAIEYFSKNLGSIHKKLLTQNVKGIKIRQQKDGKVYKFQNGILQTFEKMVRKMDEDSEDDSSSAKTTEYTYTETKENGSTAKSSNATKSSPKRSQRPRKPKAKGRNYNYSDDEDYDY